ncbi:MAG: 30S ribosomal protein S12 methylthiotransferase RimO [Candidatus Hydrogenedentota bacterium]
MKSRVFIETLGCVRNEVDTATLREILISNGYEITGDINKSDIIIINTCSFIEQARQESIDTILEYGELKNRGKIKKLIVTGCLPQYYKDELIKEIPEIDSISGTGEIDKIVDITKGRTRSDFNVRGYLYNKPLQTPIRETELYHYIKISEGCSRKCAFCKIPELKGGYRSRKKEIIIQEAKIMINSGIKELILVGQETTNYGVDRYKDYNFKNLLKDLTILNGDFRIRFLYGFWQDIDDELIYLIKENKKIYPYFDIPLQHSEKKMLRLMNREGDKTIFLNLINKIRANFDDSYIKTSLIVGHPYETSKLFERLLDFLNEAKLDRITFFPYSREEGTVSANYKNKISKKEIEKRYDVARNIQFKIEDKLQKKMIGEEIEVLVERKVGEELVGRCYRNAPEIEGCVVIDNNFSEEYIDKFIKVKITDSNGLDLYGDIIEARSKK